MKDTLVPFKHSEMLYEEVSVATELYMPKNMTHGVFDFSRELTEPFINFLDKIHYLLQTENIVKVPSWLKIRPDTIPVKK